MNSPFSQTDVMSEKMVILRKATKADARAIRALIWRVGINPMSLDWRRFWVAVDAGNRVIGTGQVKPHGDGTREMASIAAAPEWQGQGIGKAIITRLLAENTPPLYLTCRAQMEPYYLQFGFRTLAPDEMPPYFRQLYRMARLLKRIFPGAGEVRVMRKSA